MMYADDADVVPRSHEGLATRMTENAKNWAVRVCKNDGHRVHACATRTSRDGYHGSGATVCSDRELTLLI